MDAKLFGQVSGNVLEEVQKVVVDNRVAIKNAVDGLEAVVAELEGTSGTFGRLINDEALGAEIDRAIRSVADTFQNLERVTAQLADGEGSIGRLLMEDSVYASLERASQNLDSLLAEAREALQSAQDPNAGTLGMLWNDRDLARELAQAVENLNSLTRGLVEGEGTLGMLLTDDQLGQNLTTLSQRLVDGEGTLGRLLNEDELYEDISATLANLRQASTQLVSTEGTIGLRDQCAKFIIRN